MATITATLAGVPLDASSAITWALAKGIEPYQQVFTLADSDSIEELLTHGTNRSVELVLSTGEQTQTFRGLVIVGEVAPPSPVMRAVLVADQRWYWRSQWIYGSYNVRKRTGKTRSAGGTSYENRTIVNDVAYASWSLKERQTPWTADEVLADVLAQASGLNVDVSAVGKDLPIENLELDDRADMAIGRVLSLLPGAYTYVDASGLIRIGNELDFTEGDLISSMGDPVIGSAGVALLDNSAVRPSKVNVYFTREIEVAFTYDETGDATVPAVKVAQPPLLENVLQVPDDVLVVPAGSGRSGRTVTKGTWLTVDEAFEAWNAASDSGGKTISHTDVQRTYTSPRLIHFYALDDLGIVDPVWMKRIATVHQHYRKTYRIVEAWRERVRSIRAYRLQNVDPETGARGPAEAFSDHCVVPSLRSLAKRKDIATLAFNRDGYSGNLESAVPSPATVQLVDEDQGIVHIEFALDPLGMIAQILPTKLSQDPMVAPHQVYITLEGVPLATNHKVAVVLTVVPAAQSGLGQFYKVEIAPSDVEAIAGTKLTPATGPEMHIHINPGLETARIGWEDGRETAYEQTLFDGVSTGLPEPLNGADSSHDTLTRIAEAVAASIYSLGTDRYEGEITVPFAPGANPQGAANAIAYNLEITGEMTTTASLPAKRVEVPAMAFMPEGVRRILSRMVSVGRE